jgi:two-component system chemotaxis sensor kinase CheA
VVEEAKTLPKYRPAPGKIGGVLVERGHARPEDIAFALQEQEKGDRRRIGEILVASGLAKQEDVTAAQLIVESRSQETEADTIRVGVNVLDKLMTLVGELVLARNQLLQFSNNSGDAGFQAISQRMNLIATELQEEVMKTRMQPIGNIWSKFPRTVRDVAVGCGKEVRIEMEGKETELDKTIIEAIKDPLTHLVRNAVDHGIETPEARVRAGKDPSGRLTLRAFHEGGQVNIEISDDGAGLDVARIRKKAVERGMITAESAARMQDRDIFNLIFLAGLSTAEKVTNVSGRGVGMDVVKTNIEKIGGTVDVQSAPGRGTTVRVRIPLTLAIIPALIVTCGENRFAIPQVALLELVSLDGRETSGGIETVHGAPVCRLRGRLLPLVYLSRELQLAEMRASSEVVNVVVLRADDRQFGLVVDGIHDTEEIVVKPLRKQLKSIKTFAGASIMGDGRVALILDVMGLAQRAGVITELKEKLGAESAEQIQQASGEKQRFLLFAGPGESRMAVPLDTVARLEELPRSQVEKTGQQWVTQYRGKILPLVNLAQVLEERRGARRNAKLEGDSTEGHLQMLVCNHGGDAVGLVVERILDIVEDAAQVKYPASRAGVLYSAVIAGQVTELIDVPAILMAAGISTKPMEPVEVAQ